MDISMRKKFLVPFAAVLAAAAFIAPGSASADYGYCGVSLNPDSWCLGPTNWISYNKATTTSSTWRVGIRQVNSSGTVFNRKFGDGSVASNSSRVWSRADVANAGNSSRTIWGAYRVWASGTPAIAPASATTASELPSAKTIRTDATGTTFAKRSDGSASCLSVDVLGDYSETCASAQPTKTAAANVLAEDHILGLADNVLRVSGLAPLGSKTVSIYSDGRLVATADVINGAFIATGKGDAAKPIKVTRAS